MARLRFLNFLKIVIALSQGTRNSFKVNRFTQSTFQRIKVLGFRKTNSVMCQGLIKISPTLRMGPSSYLPSVKKQLKAKRRETPQTRSGREP